MRPARPKPVHASDLVLEFDCANEALNSWLAGRALRNELSGDSRTYVSIDTDTGQIAGYYSLSAFSMAHAEFGGGWPIRNAPDPVSVVLLGRLAVSIQARGAGLGRDLLADAVTNAEIGAAVLGARALVAEAIDENAQRFYRHLGLWQSSGRRDLFPIRLGRSR